MNMTVARLREIMQERQAAADKAIETWKARLEQDPAYAMEWCSTMFWAAAEKKVTQHILEGTEMFERGSEKPEVLEKPLPTEQEYLSRVKAQCLRNATQTVRSIPRSTSQPSNMLEHEMASAYYRVFEILETPALYIF
jgi:hypothetical protein